MSAWSWSGPDGCRHAVNRSRPNVLGTKCGQSIDQSSGWALHAKTPNCENCHPSTEPVIYETREELVARINELQAVGLAMAAAIRTSREQRNAAEAKLRAISECIERYGQRRTRPTEPIRAILSGAELDGEHEIVRTILEALCFRDGCSIESDVSPGEPAPNYELADRLGIGQVFGLGPR